MPKIDGLELTKQIYKLNEKQSIIIISAHDTKEHLLEFVNLGIKQFIVKPLELDKILTTLYKVSKVICKKNSVLASNIVDIILPQKSRQKLKLFNEFSILCNFFTSINPINTFTLISN